MNFQITNPAGGRLIVEDPAYRRAFVDQQGKTHLVKVYVAENGERFETDEIQDDEQQEVSR